MKRRLLEEKWQQLRQDGPFLTMREAELVRKGFYAGASALLGIMEENQEVEGTVLGVMEELRDFLMELEEQQ